MEYIAWVFLGLREFLLPNILYDKSVMNGELTDYLTRRTEPYNPNARDCYAIGIASVTRSNSTSVNERLWLRFNDEYVS